MKMTHAFLLLTASALTSQGAFSSPVTREIWNCKGDGKGVVRSLTVTSDSDKGTAEGALSDPGMTSEPVALSKSRSEYKLTGETRSGRDDREYSVLLIPAEGEAYSPASSQARTTGNAYVSYSGNVDCVGLVSDMEVLSCEVELER